LVALRDRLSELFEEAGGVRSEKNDATEAAMGWIPAVDVYASATVVVVSLELPGLSPADVTLELEGDALSVRGQRARKLVVPNAAPAETPSAAARAADTFHRLERPMGPFERLVKLPGPVDPERAEAHLALGVLTVALPRTAERVEGRGPRTITLR
jgi:HSP20 family protein